MKLNFFLLTVLFFLNTLEIRAQRKVTVQNFFQHHTIEDFCLVMNLPEKAFVTSKMKDFKRSGRSKYRRKYQFYSLKMVKSKNSRIDMSIVSQPMDDLDGVNYCFEPPCRTLDTLSSDGNRAKIFYEQKRVIVVREFVTSLKTLYFFVFILEVNQTSKYSSRDYLRWVLEAKITEMKDVFE